MAIDTQNLVYLIDPFWQAENNNGKPIVNGHMEVFIAGTDTKYITWQNWDGTKNPFKIPLGSDGRATILVEPEYTYDCYLYDSFNNLAVSRLNVKPNLGGDVYGLSQVYHDETLTGNGTVTSPLGMVSAKLGVQEPLYFVEDDSATVIGLRESAYSGLPYVENSAIGFDTDGNVSSISGLGFYTLSAGSATLADSANLAGSATIADSASISYSAENAGLVTDGWETGSDGRITAYNGTAFSAGKVYSGISPVYVDNENDKIGVSSKDFLANSPLYFTEYSDRVELSISGLPPTPGLMYESGFNYESGKITGYNGSGISAGKVYTGISPVTVDNDNDTISVASAILGVQSPLYFVEDSESATILGVDTASWTIDIPESANWDEAYSTVANNSGDWTSAADELAVLNTAKWDSTCDYVSSHSADWNNKLDADIYAEDSGTFLTALPSDVVYTADIQDMATTGDINDLVTSIAETYQTKTDMTGYLTTGDSSNFYTTANESGFITGVDLTDYATKDFVNDNVASSISGKLDIATYSSESGNFLTAVPAEYATTAWVTGQGYLTAETDWTNAITAASAYAYSEATAQIPTDYATTAQLADKLDSAIYANDSGTFLTAHQSLSESADWNSAASTVSAGYANWDASYATLTANSGDWDSTYDTVSNNSASWTGGATPTYGYTDNGLISAIDSSGLYASSGNANHLMANGTMGSNITQDKGTSTFYYMPLNSPWTTATVATGIFSPLQYATGACLAMNDTNFKSYFKGNEWYVCNNSIGQALRGEVHASRGVHISGATTAGYGFNLGIKSVSGVNSTGSWKYGHDEDAALRAVSSCDMHESAFEYDANDKISGYNGSAFAGGSDVPEGVMIESALEYNAVNEISGYNGSAFATEAHQKQWIIHDDTLLHEANSAQYALGVNVSAVAQLMSVDETVLWEGSMTRGQNGSLADSVKNYERIRFYIEETNRHRKSINEMVLTDLSNANLREFSLNLPDATTAYFGNYFTVYQINEAGTSITSVSGRQWWYNPWTSTAINGSTDRGLILKKVVGIGRKN